MFRQNELNFLVINNGYKFMAKEWVIWKWSRTGGMGKKWRNLLKKWMKPGGNVPPTMLHISWKFGKKNTNHNPSY